MTKKKADSKKAKKQTTDAKQEAVAEDIKKETEKAPGTIVIKETEEDVVLDSGFNGDPEGLKNEIKKEAAKSDVLSRFLIPLFTFIVIGIVVAGLTWYYARPEVAEQKTKEEKIENAPEVQDEVTTPATTPAPATTTPATTPAPAQATTYTVQSGDTLSSIANANGLTSKQLADYNGITNADSLTIGQTLRIPPK